jgi:hypothetical protein
VIVAVVPLMVTSILCEALMVGWASASRPATLPVIALGVGIGADYALYLLSASAQQRKGLPLPRPTRRPQFTARSSRWWVSDAGRAGVITWAWSPIVSSRPTWGSSLTFTFAGT